MEPSWKDRSSGDSRNELDTSNTASVTHTIANASSPTRRGFPEFSELVLACRHHLLLTVLTGSAISVVLVALAWKVTSASYEAKSLVRVRQYQDVVYSARTSRADDAAFVRSQEQLVRSPQVCGAALKNEEVLRYGRFVPPHDAVDWLQDRLRVDIQTGSEVLSITAFHSSPEFAQILCNAVTQAYLHEISARQKSDQEFRQSNLEKAAHNADRLLDEQWDQLNQVATKLGSDNTESLTIRDEIQLQAYRDYAQQLRAAQLRGHELQSLLVAEQLRQTGNRQDSISLTIESRIQNHPDVVVARERVAKVESQILLIREIAANENSPRLIRLYEERDSLASELKTLVDEISPQLHDLSMAQNRLQAEDSLVQLKKQVKQNEAEREFLRTRLSEIDTGVVRTSDKNGVQLEIHRHSVDRQSRLADNLWQSLEEMKIESQSQARVALIQMAELPVQANHSRQMKLAAGAAGLGWIVVILGIGYCEWKNCVIRGSEDVSARSAFQVFAVNSTQAHKDPRAGGGTHAAAANMMLLGQDRDTAPSWLVSSTTTSEQRHLLSLDLAQALASYQRKTLLIDCDASSPRLGRLLGGDRFEGMLQIQATQNDPRQFIIPSSVPGLDFLPIGTSNEQAMWVDPQTLQLAIRTLNTCYDAIVVNGPALLASPDGLLLASQVDQVVFAFFRGKSRWDQLIAGQQLVTQSGFLVAGSVQHSGRLSAPVQLLTDQQGNSTLCRSQPDEMQVENKLRQELNDLQNDLDKAKDRTAEPQIESASNRESFS